MTRRFTAVLLALILSLTPLVASAKADVTKEFTFTSESSNTEEMSYPAPEKIRENGHSYRLKDIDYEVTGKSSPYEKIVTVKSAVMKHKDEITVTENGKEMKLTAADTNISWNPVSYDRKTVTKEYEKGKTVPQHLSAQKTVDGRTVKISLELKEQEDVEKTEDFTSPATFTSNGPSTRIYIFNGHDIEIEGKTPTWEGYQADVAAQLAKDGETFTVTGGSWNGPAAYDGTNYVRYATYVGTKTVRTVKATYVETDETAADMYEAEILYREKNFSPVYNVKATAVYDRSIGTAGAIAIGAGSAILAMAAVLILSYIGKRRKGEA